METYGHTRNTSSHPKKSRGRIALVVLAILAIAGLGNSFELVTAPISDYNSVLSTIEEAAASHSSSASFGSVGVDPNTMQKLLRNAAPDESLGAYTKQRADTMLVFDRYAVDPSRITYKTVTSGSKTKVVSLELGYYLEAEQVAQAEEIVKSVAKKAASKKSKRQRLRYIHDWVVLNSAYGHVSSAKWKNITDPFLYEALNTCSGAQLLSHRGMCNSYVLTFLRICKAAGISDVRYVACSTGNGNGANHAMVVSGSGKKKAYIDVTWDDPIYKGLFAVSEYEKANEVKHQYFMCSLSYMKQHGHRVGE